MTMNPEGQQTVALKDRSQAAQRRSKIAPEQLALSIRAEHQNDHLGGTLPNLLFAGYRCFGLRKLVFTTDFHEKLVNLIV